MSTPSQPNPRPVPGAPVDLHGLARLTAFATALALVLLTLLQVGPTIPFRAGPSGEGPAPWSAWSAWLRGVGPPVALIGVVRLVAIGLAGYLLLLVTVELVGRATGRAGVLALGRRAATPLTRRLLAQIAGAGFAAGISIVTLVPAAPVSAATTPAPVTTTTTVATGPVAPSTSTDGPAPVMRSNDIEPSDPAAAPVMRALDTSTTTAVDEPVTPSDVDAADVDAAGPATEDHDPSASIPATDDAATGDPPVLRACDPGPTAEGSTDPAHGQPASPGSAAPAPAATDRWVIERGDHLWGVARRTLAAAWSRPPTDAEVAVYLADLIEANAAVLAVPGDADLVYAGQVFTLPPVAAA